MAIRCKECYDDADRRDARGRCLGHCSECGAHREATGRYTVYCPDCDTCGICGCPNADGFQHYKGCSSLDAQEET